MNVVFKGIFDLSNADDQVALQMKVYLPLLCPGNACWHHNISL